MSPLKGRKDESRKKKDVSYSVPNLSNPIKTSTLTMILENLIKPDLAFYCHQLSLAKLITGAKSIFLRERFTQYLLLL